MAPTINFSLILSFFYISAMIRLSDMRKDFPMNTNTPQSNRTFFQTASQTTVRITACIGVAITLFLSLFSCIYTVVMYTADESSHVLRDSSLQNIFFFIFFLFLAALLYRFLGLSNKAVHWLALFFSFLVILVCFALINASNTYSVSDQLHVYLAATNLYEKSLSVADYGYYFIAYPFQLGLAHVYSFLFTLFHSTAPQIAEYAQAISLGISFYTGFRITRELFHNPRLDLLYLLCSLPFIPMYLYTLFLYGESFGVCGTMLSIWFFLLFTRHRACSLRCSIPFLALSTIALLFAVLVRSSLLIIGIAILIIQLFLSLQESKLSHLMLVAAMLLLVLFGRNLLLGIAEEDAGLERGQGAPFSLWLVMGLQDSDMGPGYYNGYNVETFTASDYNATLANEKALKELSALLSSHLQQPKSFALFLKDKGLYQWCEPSYAAFTVTRFMNEPKDWIYQFYWGNTHDIAYQFLNQYQSAMYFLLLAVFLYSFHKKEQPLLLLMGLPFIGGFLFSLIWEGKSRYVYPYVVLIMPCLAKGVQLYILSISHLVKCGVCKLSKRKR